jgi:tRNA(His) guanylyltransferase
MTKTDGLDIGERMKQYENVSAWKLPKRVPVIVRIDGRAFHTITRRRFGRNWSREFVDTMVVVAKAVQKDIQGCNFCYCQSDEISFLLTDYETIKTEGYFDYDARKIISITASFASAIFSNLYGKPICFDSRCFSMPQDDICNYFLWRQIDAFRNSVQMAGREHFSHKELHKVSGAEIQEKLFQEKGINFNDYPIIRKRGFCIVNGELDENIPEFSKDRDYVEKFIYVRKD